MDNSKELEHLKWLRIGYLVNGGLMLLIALLPIIHLIVGIAMLLAGGEDAFLGLIFLIFAAIFILFGSTVSIMNFVTAKYLKEIKNHTFCLVAGGINTFFSPLGIVIGVFTFVVLLNENVKKLFIQIPAREHFEASVNQMPDWR